MCLRCTVLINSFKTRALVPLDSVDIVLGTVTLQPSTIYTNNLIPVDSLAEKTALHQHGKTLLVICCILMRRRFCFSSNQLILNHVNDQRGMS